MMRRQVPGPPCAVKGPGAQRPQDRCYCEATLNTLPVRVRSETGPLVESRMVQGQAWNQSKVKLEKGSKQGTPPAHLASSAQQLAQEVAGPPGLQSRCVSCAIWKRSHAH